MRDASFRAPLTLTGAQVRLVPLERSQIPALNHAARDPEVSRFMFVPPGPSMGETERFVGLILEGQAVGTDLPFAIECRADDLVIGATRYLRIDREDRSVEIGGTFLDRSRWRTAVNTEAKYLLLRHAFEVEQVHRVTLQTDLRNERSQAAIARLGAVREGILRDDRRFPNGTFRSSVLFSILSDEWPTVERRLLGFLSRPGAGPVPASASSAR